MNARKTFMTQAKNLRDYADDFATEPMTTRAVELGEILNYRGPDGVGHSPSGPNRPRDFAHPSQEAGDWVLHANQGICSRKERASGRHVSWDCRLCGRV